MSIADSPDNDFSYVALQNKECRRCVLCLRPFQNIYMGNVSNYIPELCYCHFQPYRFLCVTKIPTGLRKKKS